MNIERIKEIARDRGLKPGRMKKADLIRAMQIQEGNPPCYDTRRMADCGEDNCLWRESCR
jgi:hypothetical protein